MDFANINLEASGLMIPCPSKTEYHYDGLVDSIWGHTLSLTDKYNYHGPLLYDDDTGVVGRVQHIEVEGVTHYHLFYLIGSPVFVTWVRGHEETHILELLDGLDSLSEVIKREQGLVIDLKKVEDNGVVASVGGIHATLRKGHSLAELNRFCFVEGYQEARRYFEVKHVQTRT